MVRSPPPLPNLKKQKTFWAPNQHLIAESAIGLNRVRSQAPQQHLEAAPRQPVSSRDLFAYDVSRDGQRFLILTRVKQAETAHVHHSQLARQAE